MVAKFFRLMVAAGLIASIALAQAPEKKVKDQAEFDLFTAAVKETDPAKKIQLLNQWKEKYPGSDYNEDRQVMIVDTYQRLRQGENMWKAAEELMRINPKSVPGLFYLTSLVMALGNTAADRLDTGEKAARGLIANLDAIFAPDKKPATTPAEQFAAERKAMHSNAQKTIAWIEMSRKNFEKAEQEFINFLKMNPNSGNVAYWLGSVMLQEKKAEKQIPALYYLARGAYYKGEDALTDQAKQQIQAFLEKNYVSFHGDKSGLQEFIDQALKDPLPAMWPVIKSKGQIFAEQKEKLRQEDPMKYFWLELKEALTNPQTGPQYWETLKGAALPQKLKGKVISVSPERRPKEVLVAIVAEGGTAEVKLRMDAAYPNVADPGTEIEFDGSVAAEFTSDPFLLTLDQEKEKLTGWPAPPKPTPKAAPKKGVAKAATKKKE